MKKNLKHAKAVLTLVLLTSVLLTGCASNANTLASPSPSAGISTQQPSFIAGTDRPGGNMMPDSSISPRIGITGGTESIEECRRESEEMEDAIVLLTEVDDAYVVSLGDQAVVGIQFDSLYQGELDERIKKMICERIKTVSKKVDKVYITVNEDQKNAVEDLEEQLETAVSMDDIQERFRMLTEDIPVFTE